MIDEAEILENNPHRPPHMGDLPLPDVLQGEAVDHHPAGAGLDLPDEQLDDRALTAARGAYHEYKLPVLDLHGQPVEGVGAVGVFLHYVCQSYHRLAYPSLPSLHCVIM